MELRAELRQKQAISTKMLQDVKILQLNSVELEDFLKEKALENPVLEFPDPDNGHPADETEPEKKKREELIQILGSDEQNRTYSRYDQEDACEKTDGFANVSRDSVFGMTLKESLRLQLSAFMLSFAETRTCEIIMDGLDRHGFFDMSAQELSASADVSEKTARKCLELMRSLEPTGVCSCNVRECLIRQMKDQPEYTELDRRIVTDCLDLAGASKITAIAKKTGFSPALVQESIRRISRLNPYPAQGFQGNDPTPYVVPDVRIRPGKNGYSVSLTSRTAEDICLNSEYLSLYQTSRDGETREYLGKKIREAEEIREGVRKRNNTLTSLVGCILQVQGDFFQGKRQTPAVFLMEDAARMLGVHESTVSRAVRDKYIEWNKGIYPMRFFFQKSLSAASAGEDGRSSVSAQEAMRAIRLIIEGEDPASPWSDAAITEQLEKRGICIARRTVVKYREKMGFPDSRGRKNRQSRTGS